jgi:hypothetical protein
VHACVRERERIHAFELESLVLTIIRLLSFLPLLNVPCFLQLFTCESVLQLAVCISWVSGHALCGVGFC